MAIYLGKRINGDLTQFHCTGRPTYANTGGRFVSAIGPFASQLGAAYYARYGHANPEVRTCADAERLARADPNPVWQIIREQIKLEMSMSAEELAEWCQCEAEEYEPDKPMPGAVYVTEMFRQARVLEDLYQA
jgi:hypothetical protein